MKRSTKENRKIDILIICVLLIESICLFISCSDNSVKYTTDHSSSTESYALQTNAQLNDDFNSGWIQASKSGLISDTVYNGSPAKVLHPSNNSSVKYEKVFSRLFDLTNSNFIILRCTPTSREGKLYIYLTGNNYKGYAYHSLDLSSQGLPDTVDLTLPFAKPFFEIDGEGFNWSSVNTVRIDYKSGSAGLVLSNISNMAKNLSTGTVIFSFDDGWKSQYTNAFPILQKYRINATIGLITDWVNTPDFLSKKEIRSMYAAGNEIASHTAEHYNLNQLSLSEIDGEINTAKSWIVKNRFGDCSTIIYPYDNPLSKVKSIAGKYHLYGLSIRSTPSPFVAYSTTSQLDLNRYLVPPDASVSSVKDLIQKAIDNKYLLILGFHAISDTDNPTPTRWSVNNFKAISAFCAQQRNNGKLKIMTVKEFFR